MGWKPVEIFMEKVLSHNDAVKEENRNYTTGESKGCRNDMNSKSKQVSISFFCQRGRPSKMNHLKTQREGNEQELGWGYLGFRETSIIINTTV